MSEAAVIETRGVMIPDPDGVFLVGDPDAFENEDILEGIPVIFAGNGAVIDGVNDEWNLIIVDLCSSSPEVEDLGRWHSVIEGPLMLTTDHLPNFTCEGDYNQPLLTRPGLYRLRVHSMAVESQDNYGAFRRSHFRHRLSLWPVEGDVMEPFAILKEPANPRS